MQEREGEPEGAREAGAPPEGIEAAARLGAEMAARGTPPEEGGPDPREAAWADVVGPDRADWYRERFRRFQARDGGYAFTWNWVCVFFPLLWLLYRKMYGWAAALVLADLILVPVTAAAPGPAGVLSLAVMVAFPVGGNWLYYHHVNGIIARSEGLPVDEAERRDFRRRAGGVSWVGPAAVVGLTLVAALWAAVGAGPL